MDPAARADPRVGHHYGLACRRQRLPSRLAAVPTDADDGKVAQVDREATGVLEVLDEAVHIAGADLPGPAAGGAMQVAMFARWSDVEFLTAIEPVRMPDESDVLKHIERSVHRRWRRLGVLFPTAFDQLRAGDVAIRLSQYFHEQSALWRPAQPPFVQPLTHIVPGDIRSQRGGRWRHPGEHSGVGAHLALLLRPVDMLGRLRSWAGHPDPEDLAGGHIGGEQSPRRILTEG